MIFPYRAETRPTRIPIITPLLILANVGIFAYQTYLGMVSSGGTREFILQMGVIPWEITHFRDLDGVIGPLGIFFTPITSLFTHGNVFHLGFNMLYLWVFGNNVEDRMGRLQFPFFYLVCGIGAVLLHVIIHPVAKTPLIGASGAIFGVMAAYAMLFPGGRLRCLLFLCVVPIVVFIPAVIVILFFLVVQILSARMALLNPQGEAIAWFAHIGGFLTGMFYVMRMKRFIRPPRKKSRFE